MLIPIGLEQDTVRRWPWVSISLVVANIAVFLATGMGAGNQAEIEARLTDVVTYWHEHPYLELPRELQGREPQRPGPGARRCARGGDPDHGRQDAGGRCRAPARGGGARPSRQRLREAVERHPFKRWGLTPAHPTPMTFLTSMFIHGGWMHLLGNLLILWLAGPFVEDAFGRPLFAALYLISGVIAAGSHILAFPDSQMPLGGASGAIAGVMGAFLIRYALMKIRFFYFFWPASSGAPSTPLRGSCCRCGCCRTCSSPRSTPRGAGVWPTGRTSAASPSARPWPLRSSRCASRRSTSPRGSRPRSPSASTRPSTPGWTSCTRATSPAPRERLAEVLAAEPRHPDANLAMWQCFVAEGNAAGGVEHVVRVIEDALKRDEPGVALEHWRELVDEAGWVARDPCGGGWRQLSRGRIPAVPSWSCSSSPAMGRRGCWPRRPRGSWRPWEPSPSRR